MIKKGLREFVLKNKLLILLNIIAILFLISILCYNTNSNEIKIIDIKTIYNNSSKINFDSIFGEYDKKKITNFWGKENIEKTTSGIKAFFPTGSYNPSSTPRGGAGFIYKLDNELNSARLSYDLIFYDNFDFVKGGKLPGLCSGDCPRGGATVEKGFSTRFMWRKSGDLEVYAYIPNKNTHMGKSLGRGSFRFTPGKKYNISQEITLNSIGKNNGIIKIYVDEKIVYKNEKISFREKESIKIDSIIFSTFFGGGDPSWATPKDTNIEFRNFNLEY